MSARRQAPKPIDQWTKTINGEQIRFWIDTYTLNYDRKEVVRHYNGHWQPGDLTKQRFDTTTKPTREDVEGLFQLNQPAT